MVKKDETSVTVEDAPPRKPVKVEPAAPPEATDEDGMTPRLREYYSNQKQGRLLRKLAGRFASQPLNVEYKAAIKSAAEAL